MSARGAARRSPYLSPAMERVLGWLARAGPEAELVVEGREAWYGDHRTSVATVYRLLRLFLIRLQSTTVGPGIACSRYVINEQGRRILADPGHRPAILEALMENARSGAAHGPRPCDRCGGPALATDGSSSSIAYAVRFSSCALLRPGDGHAVLVAGEEDPRYWHEILLCARCAVPLLDAMGRKEAKR